MTRDDIVAEARTWLRTRFQHHQQVKGGGVDCAHLMRAVYNACGADIRQPDYYPRDWHLHRSEELFLNFVLEYADEISEAELQPGDSMLWRIGRCFSHGALYIGNGQIIHAYAKAGMVTLGRLDEEDLQQRPRRCFRMKFL